MSAALKQPELLRELELVAGGQVLPDEPMARHTSFRTGGPVRAFVRPGSRAALVETLSLLRDLEVEIVIIGGGTNVLWADGPFDGVVVNLERALDSLDFTGGGGLEAGGGVWLKKLLVQAHAHKLGGFSFLTGIPGTVGGAIRMNAGTHLGQISDVLVAVEVLDSAGDISWREASELELAYRRSNLAPDDIVLTARMQARGALEQGELDAMAEAQARRRASQPTGLPSAGSIFKNPAGDAAGRLIEAAGLKGRRFGAAMVSEVHANFIVRVPAADSSRAGEERALTSADVRGLIRQIQEVVLGSQGVRLEPEIRFAGPWPTEDGGGS